MDLRRGVVASLLVAALAGVAGAQPAAAQTGDAPPEPRARPDGAETPRDDATRPPAAKPPAAGNTTAEGGTLSPPAPGDKAAVKAHLDELFRRLADPETGDWQRIQTQIIMAWNKSGSPSMDLLSARADKAMEKKDLDTALLHLDDLVRLAPDHAEGWNKRATVHFMKQDYGSSLEDIARVLKLEPRHFGALSGLGIILDRIGDPKGALEAYRRAIAIHPNLPGIRDGIEKLQKQVEGERL